MESRRDEKLNIAVMVKRFVSSGGAERYAVETTRRLISKGHKIDLFAREAEEEYLTGLNFHHVKNRFQFSSVLNSISFAAQTARMLRGKPYDVIHSHERAYSQDILTVHTFSYRGGMERYSTLKKIDRMYLSPRSWLYLCLESRQMRTPQLVAVSPIIQEDIRKNYQRGKAVAIIAPGVDTEKFHPDRVAQIRRKQRKAEGISDDEMVLLFVGSEFRRKGLDFLVPVVAAGMRLLVVGKGEHWEYYRKLASNCEVKERVFFKGHTDEVMRYYAVADVLVLPSVLEAFGMSVLEGMACGIPVVVSSNAGVSMLVEDGVGGYIIRHPSELPSILTKLKDPQVRRQIGLKAREKAEAHTWDAVTTSYEALYCEIAEHKRSYKTVHGA